MISVSQFCPSHKARHCLVVRYTLTSTLETFELLCHFWMPVRDWIYWYNQVKTRVQELKMLFRWHKFRIQIFKVKSWNRRELATANPYASGLSLHYQGYLDDLGYIVVFCMWRIGQEQAWSTWKPFYL